MLPRKCLPRIWHLVTAALGALVFLSCSHAWAGVAVLLEPRLEGQIASADKELLSRATVDALRSQQLDIASPQERETVLAGEPQLRDCFNNSCLESIGRLLASQVVVRYHVSVEPAAANTPAAPAGSVMWRLKVNVFDVEVGALGAALMERCDRCSGAQAGQLLTEMVKRALIENVARPRGSIELTSQPSGSVVFVDGTELGITPYKRATFIGEHKLVIKHTGYRSHQSTLSLKDGEVVRQAVTMQTGSDEPPSTPVYKKWWFWVALGGAAVAASAITAGVVVGTQVKGDRTPGVNHIDLSMSALHF